MSHHVSGLHRISGQKRFHLSYMGDSPHQFLLECTDASEGQLPVAVQAVTATLAAPVVKGMP